MNRGNARRNKRTSYSLQLTIRRPAGDIIVCHDAPTPAPIRELIDKEAIRTALARFCRGVDRGDMQALQSVYHPDALENHGDFVGSAADWMLLALDVAPRHFSVMHHSLGASNIELDGDVAAVETYFSAGCVIRDPDGTDPVVTTIHGRYVDRFERRDGFWRIANRLVVKDFREVRPISDPEENYPKGRWGEADPVYEIPGTPQ
jgi:ketosteroid isomerase-like protein